MWVLHLEIAKTSRWPHHFGVALAHEDFPLMVWWLDTLTRRLHWRAAARDCRFGLYERDGAKHVKIAAGETLWNPTIHAPYPLCWADCLK